MNLQEIDQVYWKNNEGVIVYLKDLAPESMQEAYNTIQKRQMKAYSALEMNAKLENAIIKVAKKRKINLVDINEIETRPDNVKERWVAFKDIINRVNRSIKLHLNKKQNEQAIS